MGGAVKGRPPFTAPPEVAQRAVRCGVRRRLKLRGDFGEGVVDLGTQQSDGDDDDDGDEGDHDAVFDGGGAALVAAKAVSRTEVWRVE